ncbi:MAG TPA: ECF transporter S component [Clostridia bacterium]|nr:ECF transporter S component [Clostridia bacterium]
MQSQKTRLIVFTGLFTALSVMLYFFEFPIVPGLSYLKVDFSDLPAVLAAVMFGPAAGIAAELIKNLFHLMVRGFGDTMGFGDLMNFLVGCAFLVPFSMTLRALLKRAKGYAFSAIAAGLAGMAGMTLMGVVGNYLIAPPFFRFMLHIQLSNTALWAAIGGATVLNILKSVILVLLLIPTASLCLRFVNHKH